MSTDMEIFREMLSRQGINYETEAGCKIHIHGATLTFDSLGRIANGEVGPFTKCENCGELEDQVDELERKISRAISALY